MLASTRRTCAAAAAGASLLALAGCGAAGRPNLSFQHPATELSHSIDMLGDHSQLATDFHIEAGPDDLHRIFPGLSDQQTALLADAHMVFQIRSQQDKELRAFQKNVNDLPDFKFQLTTSKGEAFELRQVEHTFYLQADQHLLSTLVGHPVSLGPVGSKQWVEIDAPGLLEHGQDVGKVTQTPEPLQGPIEFVPDLRHWIDDHVTVDRLVADDVNGDKLKLTVNAKELVDELVREAGGALPALGLGPLLQVFDKAPDRDITVYAIVDDNRLSELYAWMDQFEPGTHSPTAQLPGKDPRFVLGIDTSVDEIERPDTVVAKVPLDQIVPMLQAALTSTS